jgi:hypothetical protein
MTMNASESYTPDRLLAGSCCLITDQGTLVAGQNLKRGAALGKITASGKLTQLDSTANDGSQNFFAILSADCDASAADQTCSLYLSGEFNSNAVGFKGADTSTTFKTAARALHTYFKDPVKA